MYPNNRWIHININYRHHKVHIKIYINAKTLSFSTNVLSVIQFTAASVKISVWKIFSFPLFRKYRFKSRYENNTQFQSCFCRKLKSMIEVPCCCCFGKQGVAIDTTNILRHNCYFLEANIKEDAFWKRPLISSQIWQKKKGHGGLTSTSPLWQTPADLNVHPFVPELILYFHTPWHVLREKILKKYEKKCFHEKLSGKQLSLFTATQPTDVLTIIVSQISNDTVITRNPENPSFSFTKVLLFKFPSYVK